MTPRVDPARVVDASLNVGTEVAEVVVDLIRLPRRLLRMVDSTEALLARADLLMNQAERSLEHTEGLVPLIKQVDRLGPDVAELLRVTDEVRRAVLGIPGVGMLWRRGGTAPAPAGAPEGSDQPAR
ncbi:hypothetical protein [Sporichthya sp.]|uniref:hypothetical protein n=1 Tax=Sporichthya sp. TaxID=65475 RepID=UPI0017A60536|nr:hypothetical protein [Sporichthya sp.]MBA3745388.1 hypothetical protein [Sporichthya sp.]